MLRWRLCEYSDGYDFIRETVETARKRRDAAVKATAGTDKIQHPRIVFPITNCTIALNCSKTSVILYQYIRGESTDNLTES